MLDPNQASGRRLPGQAGTDSGWRRTARRLRHSSAAVTLVCAGLGSAALPFRRDTSAAGYGFVISGADSMGKILVTHSVQSLIGHPDRLLPFWPNEAGLEEIAQAYRHMPLVLDESKSTRRDYRTAVQDIAYLLENGKPSALHWLWQGAPARIESIVVIGGKAGALSDRSGGEQVGFIEIPSDQMGLYGIIDRHEGAGVTDRALAKQWIEDRLAGLADNHGHALPGFVAQLVELGSGDVTALLDRRMAEFNRLANDELGPAKSAALRAREAFAFAYATGMLARQVSILRWAPQLIQASVLRCLAWHEERIGSAAAPSLNVIAASETLLATLRDRASRSAPPSAAELRGSGVVLDTDKREVRTTAAFLSKVIRRNATLNAVLQYLATQGLVGPGSGPPGTWLRQVRYKDGRVRAVCFDLGVFARPEADTPAEDRAGST